MKKFTLALLASCLVAGAWAQTKDIKINNPYKKKRDKTYIPDAGEETSTSPQAPSVTGDAEVDITAVIQRLFDGMYQSSAGTITSLFAPEGRLLGTDDNGRITVMTPQDFGNAIAKSPRGSLKEEVTSLEIRIDDNLATAWVGYDFYLNNDFHHCGVDAFQFMHTGQRWLITQIADTRRNDCTPGGPEGEVNALMDQWHAAAAGADARTYFDRIAQHGVFLGTDPGENWDKDAFYQFAKPFFNKGQAWNFTAKERNVFFSEDGHISWFNELLDTWMGTCRGSGVLRRNDQGDWKIEQYNLAILVPNDVVQDYVKMVKDRK